jgi:hypothetical protein
MGLKSGGIFNKGKSLIWLEVVLDERWPRKFCNENFLQKFKTNAKFCYTVNWLHTRKKGGCWHVQLHLVK